jgi:hypothetical protein
MGLTKFICRIERFISDITRIKWMRCSNCVFYEYGEFEDKMMGTDKFHGFRCKNTHRRPRDWQYCCEFKKRPKENKNNEIVELNQNLHKTVEKSCTIANLIYRRESELEALKKEHDDLEYRENYLKSEIEKFENKEIDRIG